MAADKRFIANENGKFYAKILKHDEWGWIVQFHALVKVACLSKENSCFVKNFKWILTIFNSTILSLLKQKLTMSCYSFQLYFKVEKLLWKTRFSSAYIAFINSNLFTSMKEQTEKRKNFLKIEMKTRCTIKEIQFRVSNRYDVEQRTRPVM